MSSQGFTDLTTYNGLLEGDRKRERTRERQITCGPRRAATPVGCLQLRPRALGRAARGPRHLIKGVNSQIP